MIFWALMRVAPGLGPYMVPASLPILVGRHARADLSGFSQFAQDRGAAAA